MKTDAEYFDGQRHSPLPARFFFAAHVESAGGGRETGENLHPDLATVKELQDVDQAIDGLTRRIEAIPSQIRKIEDQLNHSLEAHDERKARLAGNQKERRDLEGDIQLIRAKITRHREQIYEVKTNELYKTMMHEIEGEEAKIRSIEDRLLERMTEAEDLETYVRDAAARIESERSRVAAEKGQLEEERAVDQAARAAAAERRRTLVSSLSAGTLPIYERARKARGTAVVAVVNAGCGGCHVMLRPQFYNEVRASGALFTCESCGRILYYVESPVDQGVEGTEVTM